MPVPPSLSPEEFTNISVGTHLQKTSQNLCRYLSKKERGTVLEIGSGSGQVRYSLIQKKSVKKAL